MKMDKRGPCRTTWNPLTQVYSVTPTLRRLTHQTTLVRSFQHILCMDLILERRRHRCTAAAMLQCTNTNRSAAIAEGQNIADVALYGNNNADVRGRAPATRRTHTTSCIYAPSLARLPYVHLLTDQTASSLRAIHAPAHAPCASSRLTCTS